LSCHSPDIAILVASTASSSTLSSVSSKFFDVEIVLVVMHVFADSTVDLSKRNNGFYVKGEGISTYVYILDFREQIVS